MKIEKSNEHKDLFSSVLNINKFTHIKHKYNTNITKQTGSFIFLILYMYVCMYVCMYLYRHHEKYLKYR